MTNILRPAAALALAALMHCPVHAQQPGMTPLQPLGAKPHGTGKVKDIDQLRNRTLAVLMEEENALDLVKLNRNLKQAVEGYWKIPVKEIEFKNNYEIQGIIATKDTNFVIMQCPDRLLTITELPEEDVPTTLTVRKLELFLAENRRRIAVVRMPDEIPSLGEMIVAVKQIQTYLQRRSEGIEEREDEREARSSRKLIARKILLINEADFRDRSEIDLEELRRLYTDSVAVVSYSAIDSAVIHESPGHAFVQLVHYMRTKALHYIVNASDGKILGYFKSRNALGDYLDYHQHVTMKHVKRYAELAGVSFAPIFTKRFAQRYGMGVEVGFDYQVVQSWYLGKTYRNKTVFSERVGEAVVQHTGETEYRKTVGVGYGISFASYFDTLFSVHTGLYVTPQGQRFVFTHYDSLQKRTRRREIEFRMRYLKVPLMLGVNTNNDKPLVLTAYGGPRIGILNNAREYIDGVTFTSEDEEIEAQRSFKEKSDFALFKSSFRSIDVGFMLGAGADLKLYNNIFFHTSALWDISLRDADDKGWKLDSKTARNMALAATAGLRFVY